MMPDELEDDGSRDHIPAAVDHLMETFKESMYLAGVDADRIDVVLRRVNLIIDETYGEEFLA